jgi:hypothetical protein
VTLGELLKANQDAIFEKWLADALASYSGDAAKAFARNKDPFANPVGAHLRAATRAILDALLGQVDAETMRGHLEEIIKIRAVQEFTPSQAVGFIFRLKGILRTELPAEAADPRLAPQWAELEGRIDGVALAAFDVFVKCREQISDLRVNEVKRRVSWILEKINRRGLDPGSARIDLG